MRYPGIHTVVKHLVITLLMGLVSLAVLAQADISAMEYYVDNDPGFGNGTPISITPGSLVDIPNEIIAAAALPTGFHTLGIRARNTTGAWGFTEKRAFYIPPTVIITNPVPADINAMEYYIDNDPGNGAATAITVTTGSLVDIPNEIIAAAALPTGFHTLGIRSKNTDGTWGFAEKRQFYIPPSPTITTPVVADIQTLEYFFDADPGFGLATALTITSGQIVDINDLIPQSLSPGFHTLHVRAKNTDGSWGLSESRPVYIPPAVAGTATPADITRIEYYFDGADPGVGNGTDLPITPGQLIDLNPVMVPTSPTLADGPHYITFRAMNADSVWGMAEIDTFDILDNCTQPVAAFTPQLACAGQPVNFIDNSTSLQPDATYRWYLNGDALVDNTTTGDVAFTYTIPGTYVVALAIRQGSICFDSISTTIDIQPLPVAVFSIAGTVVNQPTTFTPSTSNLPPGASWQWDFDNDGNPEDTTAGPVSFTYSTASTYTISLTISDNNGCGVVATNTVTISDTGGGTAPPVADFLAANGCSGNAISFIDLSRNLPGGAAYDWDFDGDGTTDATAAGSQTFTYAAAGTYTATLSIDLGSSIISKSQDIEISDIPVADFSAANVCLGTPTDFTDQSTSVATGATYMWDFDNDGIIDSNAQTGVSYTYNAAGTYVVTLTIANGNGCDHQVVKQVEVTGLPAPDFEWNAVCTGETITFNDLSAGVAATATYSWDLDNDGTEDFSTIGDVEFTYAASGTYDPVLTITNPANCATTITKPIEIFDRPQVAIDVIARCYGQESQMVDLSQQLSANPAYSWDFNSDGQEDDNTPGSTVYTYASYDSYLVTLTVDNGGGCTAMAEELVVFADAATPDFMVNKTCQGEEVVFTDLSTNLANGAIYSWDFNTDGVEDAATPGSTTYTYNTAGNYSATLTIDNGDQCLAFKTLSLDITPPPAVDLGPDTLLCEAGTITLDAGTGYASYLWPDGSMEQTYTIDQIGSYTVQVQDAKGCYNRDTINIQLRGAPIPGFQHNIVLSLDGIIVEFTNLSTNADTYSWDFGDGNTAEETAPSHIYSDFSFYETSVYTVCLTASNACEEAQFCEDIFVSPTQVLAEAGESIQVYPNPASRQLFVEPGVTAADFKQLLLFDVSGKPVWQERLYKDRYEIDLTGMATGTYYLILEQDKKFMYKRIIKN